MSEGFRYTRDKARSALALGELERASMDSLWDRGEMSGNEIFEEVGKKNKIHHNTLLTVLERLIEKGLVEKRKVGKFNLYRSILTREEFCERVARPLMAELMGVSSGTALAAFVDNASADPEKLEELKRLIEEAEYKSIKNPKRKL